MSKNDKAKKKPLRFRIVAGSIRLFYKKYKFLGLENLTDESSIIIGNHAQVHGPMCCQLYFPTKKYIWCIGEMMSSKEIPSYAYKDFWSQKPKCVRWFFKLLSYVLALFAFLFRDADTIAVYKDARILDTFKQTILKLNDGANVVIFPECREKFNDVVNDFQQNFVDVAKIYYKRYNKEISFVPMYIAPRLKTVVFGKPIKYNPNIDMAKQRVEICDYLKNEITALAKSLPKHKIVVYDNVGRKNYKYSK